MGQGRLVYSFSWKGCTWVRIGYCNDELYMSEYGDSCCYFLNIYRPIIVYIVPQSYKTQMNPDSIDPFKKSANFHDF